MLYGIILRTLYYKSYLVQHSENHLHFVHLAFWVKSKWQGSKPKCLCAQSKLCISLRYSGWLFNMLRHTNNVNISLCVVLRAKFIRSPKHIICAPISPNNRQHRWHYALASHRRYAVWREWMRDEATTKTGRVINDKTFSYTLPRFTSIPNSEEYQRYSYNNNTYERKEHVCCVVWMDP